MMVCYVGLDVSQRTTAICAVDEAGRRIWRGLCPTSPEVIERTIRACAGDGVCLGLETGPLTPWLSQALRERGLEVVCLDARHARAALRLRINKTDQNDAEGLAQMLRSGWYRPVHVTSFATHRARSLLGARAQLKGMTTRLTMIRGVPKTFGLGVGEMCGTPRRYQSGEVDRRGRVSRCGPLVAAAQNRRRREPWPRGEDQVRPIRPVGC